MEEEGGLTPDQLPVLGFMNMGQSPASQPAWCTCSEALKASSCTTPSLLPSLSMEGQGTNLEEGDAGGGGEVAELELDGGEFGKGGVGAPRGVLPRLRCQVHVREGDPPTAPPLLPSHFTGCKEGGDLEGELKAPASRYPRSFALSRNMESPERWNAESKPQCSESQLFV